MKQYNPRAVGRKKRNRKVVRGLIFTTLVGAVCGLVMGLSVVANKPAAQTPLVVNAAPQALSSNPSPPIDCTLSSANCLNNLQTPDSNSDSPINDQESSTPNSESDISEGEQQTKTFLVPAKFQGKVIERIKSPNQEKLIALTFDDGPWPRATLQILDTLKKNNVKATFFWVGRMVQEYPAIAKQVVADGHAIANHTWSHSYRRMNKAEAAREIEDTAEIIYETTGVKTLYFRPPGRVMDNGVVDYALKKNFVVVNWSNDPMDYRPLPAQKLVNHVVLKAKPGDIVLMHDGGGSHTATVKAVPQIIAKLKKLGYKFVTVPELLEISEKKKSEGEGLEPSTTPSSTSANELEKEQGENQESSTVPITTPSPASVNDREKSQIEDLDSAETSPTSPSDDREKPDRESVEPTAPSTTSPSDR